MKTWRKLRDHPELWERYFIREKVLTAIRRFFLDRGFHEVETPLLTGNPAAESYLEIFETTLLDRHRNPTKAYLYTSPEMSLKKLLVAGIGNCYSLTKAFRNMETQGTLHNPEFTVLEWYQVDVGYEEVMTTCEELMVFINAYLRRSPAPSGAGRSGRSNNKDPGTLTYQGKTVDLTAPWERLTVAEAFATYASVNLDEFFDEKRAREIAQKKGYTVEEKTTWEELYNQILLNEVEPFLGSKKPSILYEFPAAVAALSNKKQSDPRYCKRFEFYIAGLELGDAYDELIDPLEMERRFKEQIQEIKKRGKTVYDYDQDFIEALRVGLPRCSGIAVGVDRLIMLFADVTDISDTLFFPARDLFET